MGKLEIKLFKDFEDNKFFEKFGIPDEKRLNYRFVFISNYESFIDIDNEIYKQDAKDLFVPLSANVSRRLLMPFEVKSWPICYKDFVIGNIILNED